MKSKYTPERVHVVRPPENDGYAPRDTQNLEILKILAQVSDKLKRSEAERYELLAELREYRRSLHDLEDKAESSEKIYFAIENRLNKENPKNAEFEQRNTELSQRQLRFEKSLKTTEDKMLKAIASQAVMDRRIRDTEDKQIVIDQRLDESLAEQAKLSRQVELVNQDKALLLRKVERLEEIVIDTQKTLKEKLSLMLLEQAGKAIPAAKNAKAFLSAPSWENVKDTSYVEEKKSLDISENSAFIPDLSKATIIEKPSVQPAAPKRPIEEVFHEKISNTQEEKSFSPFTSQNMALAAIFAAALILGWVVTQRLTNGNNAVGITDKNKVAELTPVPQDDPSSQSTEIKKASIGEGVQEGTDVLTYSDEQLLAALEKNPDGLATKLNAIEPSNLPAPKGNGKDLAPAFANPQLTPDMPNFDQMAFRQDMELARFIRSEYSGNLTDRIQSDSSLPEIVKTIEQEAFKGNAQAQHELAAIYVSGNAGVEQNFDRASQWFREAAEKGVANAQYNLGVLYHQGLGKERDLARALFWYREAAKQAHPEAQYNLGIAHIEGIGTEYNPQLAAAFFERAANAGIAEAAYNLGLIHDNGLMGQTKPEEALLWYKIASDGGSKEAKSAMDNLMKNLQIDIDEVNTLVDKMQKMNESTKGHRAGPVSKNEAVIQSTDLIKQIQEYLMLTGGFSGPADGIYGDATQEAVKAYQAANNLPVDGKISEDLLNSMVGGALERLNKEKQ